MEKYQMFAYFWLQAGHYVLPGQLMAGGLKNLLKDELDLKHEMEGATEMR